MYRGCLYFCVQPFSVISMFRHHFFAIKSHHVDRVDNRNVVWNNLTTAQCAHHSHYLPYFDIHKCERTVVAMETARFTYLRVCATTFESTDGYKYVLFLMFETKWCHRTNYARLFNVNAAIFLRFNRISIIIHRFLYVG